MDKYLPLHIYSFNIVAKIPRKSSDNQPAFLQCIRHTKVITIFGLILLDICINFLDFCNRVPHYIYAKITELGASKWETSMSTYQEKNKFIHRQTRTSRTDHIQTWNNGTSYYKSKQREKGNIHNMVTTRDIDF